MGLIRARKNEGIALFMVLAAVSVLSIIVTEFTYITQMNQKLAFDSTDQLKAHYLAKSGLKLSLLRLKAYSLVKDQISQMGGAAAKSMVPQSMLDKIWSFPFMYPIPSNLPGLSMTDKDSIEKFQKSSGLEGSFSAIIESASQGYNMNMILPGFGPDPSPSPSPSPGGPPSQTPGSNPSPSPSPSAAPYNADEARKSLADYLAQLFNTKAQDNEDFANDHKDFRIEDFMDGLTGWADPSYERKTSTSKDIYPMKRAPFFSLSELHMLPGMDDDLYNLFAPALTATRTPGININQMKDPTLRAIVPNLTEDEIKEFFKFRDDPELDNAFKSPDDFWKYISTSVAVYKGNPAALDKVKENLTKQNVRLITDESEFKITIVATVNDSTRKIEAWVTLGAPKKASPTPTANPAIPVVPGQAVPAANTADNPPDPGLRITFMKIM